MLESTPAWGWWLVLGAYQAHAQQRSRAAEHGIHV